MDEQLARKIKLLNGVNLINKLQEIIFEVVEIQTSETVEEATGGSAIPSTQAEVTAGTAVADKYVQPDTLKVELDKKGDNVDATVFQAVGSENSLGINQDDDTLQKIATKLDAYSANANDRKHLTNTSVSPAIAGKPTLAEISTSVSVASLTDTIVYYTGDNLPISAPTHVYHVDNSGGLTLLESPSTEEGLRGTPVTDNAALTELPARNYERRKVLADGKEYVFELGAVSGTLADDSLTGFWQEQTISASEPLPKLSIQLGTDWNNVSANNAYQVIDFSASPWIDTENGWNDANNSYTVSVAGDYDAVLNLLYQNNGNTSNDPCVVHIRVNGVDTDIQGVHDYSDQINGTSGMSFHLRGVLKNLQVDDVITCEVFDQDDIIVTKAGSTFELTKSDQEAVINTTDIPVDDQATSGYIDIGTMRMQWGVTDGSLSITTVTFPQPFANTDYSIIATPNESGGYSATAHTKTTTSALVHARVNTTNGNAAIITSWQAIGLKP